jgi:hypothetical protein
MEKDSKKFLAMIVRGSGNRPHFAGQAYIRDGIQTVVASGAQFEAAVAQRNSKVYEILKWRGQVITTVIPSREIIYGGTTRDEPEQRATRNLVGCDQFYIILKVFP